MRRGILPTDLNAQGFDRLDEKYRGDRRRRHFPLKKLPSEYIRSGNVYFTCELEEKTLDVVVREVGENVLMYPSDFPHERAREEFAEGIPEFLKRSDLSDDVKKRSYTIMPNVFTEYEVCGQAKPPVL